MRAIIRSILLVAVFVSTQGTAFACQPGNFQPFSDLLKVAGHVAVVRVLSAEVDARDPADTGVVAHVRLVETLRGAPLSARTLSYQGGECWGVRLDVGQYFLLATSEDAPEERLDHYRTQAMALLPFGYLPPEAWTRAGRHEDDIRTPMQPLRKAIAGKGPMPSCEIADGVARASSMPLPAPRCR